MYILHCSKAPSDNCLTYFTNSYSIISLCFPTSVPLCLPLPSLSPSFSFPPDCSEAGVWSALLPSNALQLPDVTAQPSSTNSEGYIDKGVCVGGGGRWGVYVCVHLQCGHLYSSLRQYQSQKALSSLKRGPDFRVSLIKGSLCSSIPILILDLHAPSLALPSSFPFHLYCIHCLQYLRSVRPLLKDEEYQEMEKLAEEFKVC